MIGFCLIGCGRISKKHAGLLASGDIKGGKLIGVCDIDPIKAAQTGEEHNVPYFTNMHKMLCELGNKIDIISILTESGNHARHCIEMAQYGKHILVEKPMALTLDDADAMIRACDQYGVKLFVVKQNRYNLPVTKLREAIESERFGKLVMGTVRVRWCRPQEYYDQAPWRGTWAEDGGVFANQASHHVDLLEWMMGEPESVFAYGHTALVDIEAEDTGVAVIKFQNGAIGVIEATTATRPKDLEGSVSILGEKGTVEIGGFAVNEMKIWNFTDAQESDESVISDFKENPPNVYGFGHFGYLNHVVDVIENGKQSLVDGLEGRKSLRLISAIYESMETGQEVRLHFTPSKCRLGLG